MDFWGVWYKERLCELSDRKMGQSFKWAIHRRGNTAVFISKREGMKGGRKGGKDLFLVWLLGEGSIRDRHWIIMYDCE